VKPTEMISLYQQIAHFETSDRSKVLPDDVKGQIVHELCLSYTRQLSSPMRTLILRATLVALKRGNLHVYIRPVHLAL
jgi:hypothetical protein